MAKFIVRLELEGYTNKKGIYDDLHEKMEAAGFKRTLSVKNGADCHLPNGLYRYVGEKSVTQVKKLALDIGESLWDDVILFVAEYDKSDWKLNEV